MAHTTGPGSHLRFKNTILKEKKEKRELASRLGQRNRSKKPVDFDSVWTYLPIIGLYIMLLVAGLIYGAKNLREVGAPYVVITGFLLLAFSYVIRDIITSFFSVTTSESGTSSEGGTELPNWTAVDARREKLDLVPAAIIVLGWMAYGLLFRGRTRIQIDIVPNVVSVLAAVVVAFTYWKDLYSRSNVRKIITLSTAAALLYIPTSDTVAFEMSLFILVAKITTFYLVYVMTESEARGAIIPRDDTFYASTERKVVQAGWILMATGYILVCSIFQIVYLSWVVYSRKMRTSELMSKRNDDYSHRINGLGRLTASGVDHGNTSDLERGEDEEYEDGDYTPDEEQDLRGVDTDDEEVQGSTSTLYGQGGSMDVHAGEVGASGTTMFVPANLTKGIFESPLTARRQQTDSFTGIVSPGVQTTMTPVLPGRGPPQITQSIGRGRLPANRTAVELPKTVVVWTPPPGATIGRVGATRTPVTFRPASGALTRVPATGRRVPGGGSARATGATAVRRTPIHFVPRLTRT